MAGPRAFVPVGIPAKAVKLLGSPQAFGVSPWAQTLAFDARRTQTILSAGRWSLVNVIQNQDSSLAAPWTLRHEVLYARSETQSVVASPKGIYRVDIATGARFVCEPSRLVGMAGAARVQIIYGESRLDGTRAALRSFWQWTRSGLASAGRAVATLASKIPVSSGLRKRSQDLLQSPRSALVTVDSYLARPRQLAREYSASLAAKTFHLTHPPKLQIEGPCSVLVKG